MTVAPRRAFETLFGDLKSKNDDTRLEAARDLRLTLDSLQRESGPNPADFQDVYRQVVQRATSLALQGTDSAERIGGIHALSALVDFKGDDAAQRTTRFANTLRGVMRGQDTAAMIPAARALGLLATPGNPLTAELVDSEVKVALESLQVDRQEPRRFAAVLTLCELAKNSPTLLYQYVTPILDVIWPTLRDPRVLLREKTAEAVSAFFEIIAARDMVLRDQWFSRIYGEIQRGFQMNSVETIHGSLLALKELLLKGGMFMQGATRYQDACDKVFLYKDSRDTLIRKEVTTIIPILAAYHPTEFSNMYLHKFMMHLQGQLKREKDRNPAFVAIGQVASAVESAIEPYLDGILVYIREGLSVKARNKSTNDAPIFECISLIAIAVGQTLTKYKEMLLDPIFACGLSDALTQALVDMAFYIPPARPSIQVKLLNLLSNVLCGRDFSPVGSPNHNMIPSNFARDHKEGGRAEHRDAEVTLALQTLGNFDFSGYIQNEFVRDVVVNYVEDENPAIRRAAALTSCQLLIRDPVLSSISKHAILVVNSVVERLLSVAISDSDPDIRHVVLMSLNSRFDKHLARAENIRSLFLALHDELFSNREAAMSIVGRLTAVNPAYVFPPLRKVLIQLLTEIEYANDSQNQQESCRLISHLVTSSSRLIKPYVDPIVHVLMPKTRNDDESVAATALAAVGDLSTVGGEDMRKYIPSLMVLIIRYLQDPNSATKRSAALKTLGQLAGSAGYVIEPYIEHPELLTILMNIVKVEPPGPLRRETIRLIGILGALDPYKHQQVVEHSPDNALAAEANDVTDVSLIINGLKPSHEDYYPTIVIHTLANMTKDQSLQQYHPNIIEAIMNIYNTMGTRCVQYLHLVIPCFLYIISLAPPARTDSYFAQMSQLVRVVRQHIRPHLEKVLSTVTELWEVRPDSHATMLTLVESIARSLEGEFKVYLASILPIMLRTIDEDKMADRLPSHRVLKAILVIGSSAEEYMHLIIPVMVRMFEKPAQPTAIRKAALDCLGRLSRKVNLSEFAARLIHPICRVMASHDTSLRQTALDTLCALIYQMGPDYLHFVPTVNKVLANYRIPHNSYSAIVIRLQKGEPLPQNLSPDEHYGEDIDENRPADIATKPLAVNQEHLRAAAETSQRSTRDDWLEWIRRLSIELLKESPHQALRSCFPLASVHPPTAKALFNSAFISCYTLLFQNYQRDLVHSIETALTSPQIPPEILQQLLNLAEFMEHDDKALPIDVRTLGMYAGKCHAYAKALHYKELEFNADQSPSAVEALIHINNQLQQSDAAFGILRKAQTYHDVELKETWFEKLDRWEEALESYQNKERTESYSFEVTMGRMRCLHALGEWDVLSSLAEERWARAASDGHQRIVAPLAAAAAWGLGQWERVDKYMNAMKQDTPDRYFFGAILAIHRGQFMDANQHIEHARDGLDNELSAVLGESYNRAYNVVVRIQMLAELEEIITYKQNDGNSERQEMMRQTWTKRLKGCQRNVDTWQRMLKVRALVVKPEQNMEMLLKFANLCRKAKRYGLAEKSLGSLVKVEEGRSPAEGLSIIPTKGNAPHPVTYAILKYLWSSPMSKQEEVFDQLKTFIVRLDKDSSKERLEQRVAAAISESSGASAVNGYYGMDNSFVNGMQNSQKHKERVDELYRQRDDWRKLLARCHLKNGQWQATLLRGDWHGAHAQEILTAYNEATKCDPTWYKAWHAWALANFEVVNSYASSADRESRDIAPTLVVDRVVPAMEGFFKSIALTSTSSLQDTLRLLTLWFSHGAHREVDAVIKEGVKTVSIDTWLEVIPQLIARINQPSPTVRKSIQSLLEEVGHAHPQALVYPLTVSIKSDTSRRSKMAADIMKTMQSHSPRLVEQADLVSHELIRIAVLWHEQWHEGLEEASRLFFGEGDVEGMLNCLKPLHDLIDQGPQTLREISFVQTFGRELADARGWCDQYRQTADKGDLNQAWDVYYGVFKKIAKQIVQITTVDLQYVSPKLKDVSDLELALPGTYKSGKPVIRISSFVQQANVISSKQRPRRLELLGSDGQIHMYVLKGHEDIRQDERVMQLFGLCNTLLSNDPECLKRHLNIQRYSAIPLSTQSGLLGWVPQSDTLHVLIREYRENRSILLNIEHRIMLQMAPDYDNLTLMQKVEVFSYAMDNTTGQDLYRVLWLKSKSSEAWLDRRTNYIRSLGVMSMVGYILGLGDRHPSNLMLDKVTGKIIHIDFGDCFDVAMNREKYPERVPFRLTRMLTYAMEVSNIEGSFRTTCENVMRVLRDNKESLMAVLEAFIHDPLLTWRLNERASPPEPSFRSERRASIMGEPLDPSMTQHPSIAGSLSGRPRMRSSTAGSRPSNLINGSAKRSTYGPTTKQNGSISNGVVHPADATVDNNEVQNLKALQVLARVREKLTGRDFKPNEELNVEQQVSKLIFEATNLENLCQHYIGWCSFW
ncbi:MAG: phosphatidylinositol kinase- protein kinase tor1 [Chrysothrix sp. TS-e1954]|nr:MAG: phosphatidylinositol kinase- protein kinase tor1 [Chrysothrix sp. TS-e1954]